MCYLTKLSNFLQLLFVSAFLLHAGTAIAQNKTVTEKTFDHEANLESFAFGADISWLSQQESWGTYYCNRAGKKDVIGLTKGYPDIDFLAIASPEGVGKVTAGNATGIVDIKPSCETNGLIYDLQCIPHLDSESLPQGKGTA